MSALCLGARVRIRKTGLLGTVQFERELVPAAGSTGAHLGMYPIIAIEVAGDDGEIYWPSTAEDVDRVDDGPAAIAVQAVTGRTAVVDVCTPEPSR